MGQLNWPTTTAHRTGTIVVWQQRSLAQILLPDLRTASQPRFSATNVTGNGIPSSLLRSFLTPEALVRLLALWLQGPGMSALYAGNYAVEEATNGEFRRMAFRAGFRH